MSLTNHQLTCEIIVYMSAAYSEHGNSGSLPADAMGTHIRMDEAFLHVKSGSE